MIEVRLLDNMGVRLIKLTQAKDKEQAVLYLYRVYNLQPVVYGETLSPGVFHF